MPRRTSGSLTQYYRLEGADHAPVVVLAHSLGLDHGAWDAQAAALAPYFRVLRADMRGHGASDVTGGDYTVETFAGDTVSLLDALGFDRVAFCGLSIGGMVGQWLGTHAADRLTHLVLANTSPRTADPGAMETRRQLTLERGMGPVVDLALPRWFTPAYLRGNSAEVAYARRTLLSTDPIGYAGCCAAVRDWNHVEDLDRIGVPTLVISGDDDVSMPWPDHGEVLARSIPGARAVRLPAAHISNLERPRAFTRALLTFLLPEREHSLDDGFRVRRAVLGDPHVDRAIARTTDLTRDFQALITRYAWGEIWARPGLDHRTRRLLVLVLMAALGRWEEFRMHLTVGLDHGLEWCDVEEALLQTAIYAGVPAANTGFHVASELWSAREAPNPDPA